MQTTDEAVAYLKTIPNAPVKDWFWRGVRRTKDGQQVSLFSGVKGYEHRIPLARQVVAGAKLELDEGVLACVIASEFPLDYPAYLLAGARAVINDASALFGREPRGDAILRRVCGGSRAPGYFGRQAGDGSARWCSSYQPPTLRSLEAARLALAGVGEDLAKGARRWIDPKVQDGRHQAGEKLDNDALGIIRKRYAEGWELVKPDPRIDQYVLALLADSGGVPLPEAERVIAAGRRRWGLAY